MQHTYNIKMRAALWTMLGVVCFAATLGSSSTWAQSGCFIDKNGTRACPVGPSPGGGSGGGSGGTSSTPSGPSPEQVKQQQERARLKAKAWSSDEALDYVDRKDWDNAIRSFEEALDRDPDDPDLNDGLNRAKAEKTKAQMPAVASPSRPAPSNDSKVVDTRNEPGGKSKLKGTLATPKPAPHTDTSVVDARNIPSGLPKSVNDAIPHTPSGDRVRKGFQAIQAGDWKAALAWFQDARNKEPGNPGIGRLVDLAKFTLEYRTRAQTPAVEKKSTPVQSAQSPNQNTTINSTSGAVAKSDSPAVEPGDGSLARAVAGQMAARVRADAAFKQYVKKYGDHDAAGRASAVSKASRGEGYSDEELKVQLQKSLADYRKNYRKNHPNGPDDSVGGSPAAEEIVLGGKG